MAKDLHVTAFDEGTKIKLLLYEEYMKEWLPVFLSPPKPICDVVNIFDFFAGPGSDINDCKGSPLIALDIVQEFPSLISGGSPSVHLYFNEKVQRKLRQLKEIIEKRQKGLATYQIHYSSLDFTDAFAKYYPRMRAARTANFLFLDQNGVKQITPEIFSQIVHLRGTDFLFFISSSIFNRFADHPDIKKYHPGQDEQLSAASFKDIHRTVYEYYKKQVPPGTDYYLAPFSIKKGANIYGLIFGTGNILGLEKFLARCWKIDPQRGEANYDIDEDHIDVQRPFLFQKMNKPKKLQIFEKDLSERIMAWELHDTREIYQYALTSGFLAEHARKVVADMQKQGRLPRQKLPISYDSCIKKKIIRQVEHFQ